MKSPPELSDQTTGVKLGMVLYLKLKNIAWLHSWQVTSTEAIDNARLTLLWTEENTIRYSLVVTRVVSDSK